MGDMICVKVTFDVDTALGATLAGMRPRTRSGLVRMLAETGSQAIATVAPAPTPSLIAATPRAAAGLGKTMKAVDRPRRKGIGDTLLNIARLQRRTDHE